MSLEERLSEWVKKTHAGEVCGFYKCGEKPLKQCLQCGLNYCETHTVIHLHFRSAVTHREIEAKWRTLV